MRIRPDSVKEHSKGNEPLWPYILLTIVYIPAVLGALFFGGKYMLGGYNQFEEEPPLPPEPYSSLESNLVLTPVEKTTTSAKTFTLSQEEFEQFKDGNGD